MDILNSSASSASNSNSQFITIIKTKDMKYALMAINRFLICLGDLERYREMIFPSQSQLQRDYSTARSYYLRAMCLAPKSSRSYHQLAILAIYTKRRLDACYYYFRCLEVSSPLTSVRQSLNSIFEEVRVKTDSINNKIKNAILLNKEKLQKKTLLKIIEIVLKFGTSQFSVLIDLKLKDLIRVTRAVVKMITKTIYQT